MTDRIAKKLDRLTELRATIQTADDDINDLFEQAVREMGLTDRHDTLTTQRANAELQAKALEAEIKKEVEAHGSTVRGDGLMAVHSIRSSWDSKGLKGYAVAHPELLAFLSEKASVSIRTIKKKDNDDEPPPKPQKDPSTPVQAEKPETLGDRVLSLLSRTGPLRA